MRTFLLGMLGLGVLAPAGGQPAITAFTNFPRFETATLSPGGKYIAVTRRSAENETITVLELPALGVISHTTFGELTDIERVEWANDDRLLIQPMRRFPGFTAYKVPTGEIFGMDRDGDNLETLFGYAAGQQQTGTHLRQRESIRAPARLLRAMPSDPSNVLIQTYGYGIEGDFNSAYRMDVTTGLLSRAAMSPVRDGTFVTNFDGRPVFVYGNDDEGHSVTYHRARNGDDWRLVASGNGQQGAMIPIGPWSSTGEFLVLDNRDTATSGVFSYNPQDGSSELLFRSAEVDISGWSTDPSGKPWVFTYEDHYPRYWYPDPQHPLALAHQSLITRFPDFRIEIDSVTSDMSRAVARMTAPRIPLVFLYTDVANKQPLSSLLAYPDLEPTDLADVEAIEFRARDGLEIRGLLTMPNTSQKKELPMIVLVHGGPHGVYNVYGFDYEAQLFASRGYVVLQVNYRGSGGRGRDFKVAGYGKWGAEMQDDITDAVRWAIGDRVADPKRICIYGASYGAYAALTGAFREPDLFRCAVGMAGVYDLPLMFERGDIQSVELGVNYLKAAVGTNTQELARRSPVHNADKIRARVMLLHGNDDERAPIEHAERMRDALDKAGNPPEWITEWGEGHGFFDETNRAEAYGRILEFFAKHLAPAASG
jgi:dipeptidyl aminopeptidase/acylaminoacyl peptidase